MKINGKQIADKIYNNIKNEVKTNNLDITLAAILVGNNPSSLRYIKQKQKWADYVGIKFKLITLSQDIKQNELENVISEVNNDNKVSGYIVQLPLPKHINSNKIIDLIDPRKDIDGFHGENIGKTVIGDESGFTPCTPAGVIKILEHIGIDDFRGKMVTVIGRSNIVGKPITSILLNKGATVVNCNSRTKNISHFTHMSDIIVVAAGVPGLLKLDMISNSAIVIDVGFTVIDGIIHGDADTKNIDLAGNKITPVPGGVGSLTVAMLMSNTLKAYKLNK